MGAGQVVILNGVSSAGKTSIAKEFQAQRAAAGEPWLVTGTDDAIEMLPAEWFELPDHHGPFGAEGLTFIETDAGTEIRIGPTGERLFRAGRRVVATWAREGFNVLVDEVVLSEATARDWDVALAGLDVTWVAVRCDPDVNDARELARGDRHVGLARVQRETVHAFTTYAFELDTTRIAAPVLAAQLAEFVSGRD